MKRWLYKIPLALLVPGAALTLWTPSRAVAKAVGSVLAVPVADPSPPSTARPQEFGEGAFRFEVEPDDVEIYLDEHYLGRAGELRGRTVEGILAGNRLLELRWGSERTFLQVVVPVNAIRTIRVNLGPSGPGSSRSDSWRSQFTQARERSE